MGLRRKIRESFDFVLILALATVNHLEVVDSSRGPLAIRSRKKENVFHPFGLPSDHQNQIKYCFFLLILLVATLGHLQVLDSSP